MAMLKKIAEILKTFLQSNKASNVLKCGLVMLVAEHVYKISKCYLYKTAQDFFLISIIVVLSQPQVTILESSFSIINFFCSHFKFQA